MLKTTKPTQSKHKRTTKRSICRSTKRQIRTTSFKQHNSQQCATSPDQTSPITQQTESISTLSSQPSSISTPSPPPSTSTPIHHPRLHDDPTHSTVHQLDCKTSTTSRRPQNLRTADPDDNAAHLHNLTHLAQRPSNAQIHPIHASQRSFQTRYNTVPSYTASPDLLSKDDQSGTQTFSNQNNYVSPNQPPKGVYTSSHYKLTRETIANYLTRKNLTFKHSGDKTIIMECPLCPKPTYGKPDNLWKLCIFDNGAFVCLRCQSKGSWYDFKSRLGDLPNITNAVGKPIYQKQQGIIDASSLNNTGGMDDEIDESMKTYMKEQQQEYAQLSQQDCQKMVANLDQSPLILDWFENQRHIKRDTLVKYHVGVSKQKFPSMNPGSKQVEWVEQECMTFPWTDRKSVTDESSVVYTRVKMRSSSEKKNMRLLPKGGSWGFFGWHTVPLHAKSIIITEGEIDAMSVWQTTGLPTISLPNGANSLPPALLPCLEKFEKIILWLDDDQSGHAAVESMTAKLGAGRTYHIPGGYGAKDANEALQKGLNLGAILDTATRQQHKQISTFAGFRHEVKQMFLDPNTQVGVPFPNMPVLQSLIKGHRRGELTILTGGTGVGKTTLLTQISLELASGGVNTLWGSFEIKNPRLAKTMMKQYAAIQGVVLNEQHPEAFDYIADKFEELPLNFLKFYGSSPVQEVIEAMEYATYVHDVQHVILDNLQFMLSGQGRATGDKFDLQDRAIEAFRQFASQRNVHVTLVIHPRKEQDNSSLGVASVFGSAKATQEADNVMIIQGGLPRTVLRNIQLPEAEGRKTSTQLKQVAGDLSQGGGFDDPIIGEIMSTFFRTIEIRKNRWDGDLGSVPLRFDKSSSRFYELSSDDITLGLGEFIMKQKKLKQMDLIKHMNQLPGTAGQPNHRHGQAAPRSGFQNMQQSYHHNHHQKGERAAPMTKSGIHNALDQHFAQQTSNKSSGLTPEQEMQLHAQFQQYAGGGGQVGQFGGDMDSIPGSDDDQPTPQTTGIDYGSPEALALRNMEAKMLDEMAEQFEGTNRSSGNFQNHPQFEQLKQKQQQFQTNAARATLGRPPADAPKPVHDASKFKQHKAPTSYEPTIDIVFE